MVGDYAQHRPMIQAAGSFQKPGPFRHRRISSSLPTHGQRAKECGPFLVLFRRSEGDYEVMKIKRGECSNRGRPDVRKFTSANGKGSIEDGEDL